MLQVSAGVFLNSFYYSKTVSLVKIITYTINCYFVDLVEQEADLFWVYISAGCIFMVILIIILLVYCRVKGEKQI